MHSLTKHYSARLSFSRKKRYNQAMPPFLIALFAAAGISTWAYNKAMHYTGNNTQNSLVISGATAIIVFFVTLTILSFVDSILQK